MNNIKHFGGGPINENELELVKGINPVQRVVEVEWLNGSYPSSSLTAATILDRYRQFQRVMKRAYVKRQASYGKAQKQEVPQALVHSTQAEPEILETADQARQQLRQQQWGAEAQFKLSIQALKQSAAWLWILVGQTQEAASIWADVSVKESVSLAFKAINDQSESEAIDWDAVISDMAGRGELAERETLFEERRIRLATEAMQKHDVTERRLEQQAINDWYWVEVQKVLDKFGSASIPIPKTAHHESFSILSSQESMTLLSSLCDGYTGQNWQNNSLSQTRTYQRPGEPHYIVVRASGEQGEGLERVRHFGAVGRL